MRRSLAPPPLPTDLFEAYFHPGGDAAPPLEDPAATEEGTLFLVPRVFTPLPPAPISRRSASPRAMTHGTGLAVPRTRAARPIGSLSAPPSTPPPSAPPSTPFAASLLAPVSTRSVPSIPSTPFMPSMTAPMAPATRTPAPTVVVVRHEARPSRPSALVAVTLVGMLAVCATLAAGWQLATEKRTASIAPIAPITTSVLPSEASTPAPLPPPAYVAAPAITTSIPVAATAEPQPAPPRLAPRAAIVVAKPSSAPFARLSFSVPATASAPPAPAKPAKPRSAQEILDALGEEQLRR